MRITRQRDGRQPTGRVAVFVDGFNMYYSLRDQVKPKGPEQKGHPHFIRYYWLDYRKLALRMIQGRGDAVVGRIRYYSAYRPGNPDAQQRHQVYITALRTKGVIHRMGRYKKRDHLCPALQEELQGAGGEDVRCPFGCRMHQVRDGGSERKREGV